MSHFLINYLQIFDWLFHLAKKKSENQLFLSYLDAPLTDMRTYAEQCTAAAIRYSCM